MTALGVGDSAKEIPAFFRFNVKNNHILNIPMLIMTHREKVLESSGLDWTVVRPVMLTDKS